MGQRRAHLGGSSDVFSQEVFHPVGTQASSAGAGKHDRVSAVWNFAQPRFENGCSFFGKRCRTFLPPLAEHADMGARPQEYRHSAHAGQLGKAQSALNGDQENRVISASRPSALIGGCEQSFDFRSGQKGDLTARKSLAGNGSTRWICAAWSGTSKKT